MAKYHKQQGPMGTDRLISVRTGNIEKVLELDRAQSKEAAQKCNKTSLEMEPTGEREEGMTKEYLAPGFRGWNGRQWAL